MFICHIFLKCLLRSLIHGVEEAGGSKLSILPIFEKGQARTRHRHLFLRSSVPTLSFFTLKLNVISQTENAKIVDRPRLRSPTY